MENKTLLKIEMKGDFLSYHYEDGSIVDKPVKTREEEIEFDCPVRGRVKQKVKVKVLPSQLELGLYVNDKEDEDSSHKDLVKNSFNDSSNIEEIERNESLEENEEADIDIEEEAGLEN